MITGRGNIRWKTEKNRQEQNKNKTQENKALLYTTNSQIAYALLTYSQFYNHAACVHCLTNLAVVLTAQNSA